MLSPRQDKQAFRSLILNHAGGNSGVEQGFSPAVKTQKQIGFSL